MEDPLRPVRIPAITLVRGRTYITNARFRTLLGLTIATVYSASAAPKCRPYLSLLSLMYISVRRLQLLQLKVSTGKIYVMIDLENEVLTRSPNSEYLD